MTRGERRKPPGNDAHINNGSKKGNRYGWKGETFTRHTLPQSWPQNDTVHFPSPRYWTRSHTNSGFQNNGVSTPCFMWTSLRHIRRRSSMGATSSGPFPTSWMAMKNMKWNVSSIQDVSDVGVRYSTWCTGRVIQKRTTSGSHGRT